MTIRYALPIDENQFLTISEQIGAQKNMVRKRVALSKAISLTAIVLFTVNLAILLVSLLYSAVALDVELIASVGKLTDIPVIGPMTQWCFEHILLGLNDWFAILWSFVFLTAAPVVAAVVLRIIGGIVINGSASGSASETDQEVTVERLNSELSDLRSLTNRTNGVKPTKICSFLVCLLLVGYLFYGAYLTEELDALLESGVVATLIGMAVTVVILFFVFLCLMNLFLACLRPLYRVSWNAGNRTLMSELAQYEAKKREAEKAAEQARLEAMSTEELYEIAYELPLWDEKALQIMRILAARGDSRGRNYLEEYEYHLKEEREEKMTQYFREGRDQEERGNDSRARSLYKMAADMGHPDGMYNYARLCYKCGSVSEAKRYLKMCIDDGFYDDEHTRALLRAMESGQNITLV